MLINSAKDELQNTYVVFLGKMELQVIKTVYVCYVLNDDITKIKTNVNLI